MKIRKFFTWISDVIHIVPAWLYALAGLIASVATIYTAQTYTFSWEILVTIFFAIFILIPFIIEGLCQTGIEICGFIGCFFYNLQKRKAAKKEDISVESSK